MANQPQPCVFCKTIVNVGYCGLCKKWMCESCSKKYWARFKAATEELRYKLHLPGGRHY